MSEHADDLVDLGEYDYEEALIVAGLLESNGIPPLVRTSDASAGLAAYQMVPRRQRIYVMADKADEARELLAEQSG
jgi:hypothetical protein